MQNKSVVNLFDTLNMDILQHQVQHTAILVPITTNKLLELCRECIEELKADNRRAKISLKALYRATLVQLSRQLITSHHPDGKTVLANVPCKRDSYSFMNAFETISDINVFPLAQLINSVGYYSLNDISFRGYVPSAVKDEKGRIIPDPFIVTIENLESFANYLSDPKTDINIRKYFHDHNPFCEEDWSNDGQYLLNKNNIISKNYNPRTDLSELRDYCQYFWKYPYLIGKCNFDGNGNAVELINVKWSDQSQEFETFCDYSIREEIVSELAVVFRIGETPCSPIIGGKDVWNFRSTENISFNCGVYYSRAICLSKLLYPPSDFVAPYSSSSDSE